MATREQGNTAAVGQVGNPNYKRVEQWRHSDHRTPVRRGDVACGDGDGQRLEPVGPACGLYHDFNGRYTSVCGL